MAAGGPSFVLFVVVFFFGCIFSYGVEIGTRRVLVDYPAMAFGVVFDRPEASRTVPERYMRLAFM